MGGTVDAFIKPRLIKFVGFAYQQCEENYYEQNPTFDRKLCIGIVFHVDGMLRIQAHNYRNASTIDGGGNAGTRDRRSKPAFKHQLDDHDYD
jgi:hypothetical protein